MTQSSILTLSQVSYTFPGASAPTIDHASVSFPKGWTGIIGNNGCGKTTLARLACGLLTPDSGQVSPRLSYAYCEQDAGVQPELLFDFSCDYNKEAQKLRSLFNIDDEMLWRFSELSAGEQKKIQIAVALWTNPELLILDEPTNHVDAACRNEISHVLSTYKGTGLLISHDRTLLDNLVTHCLCFENRKIIMRPGTYSEVKRQSQLEIMSATREKEAQKARIQKLQTEYAQRSHKAAQTAKRRSAKNLDKHDRDGRAKIKLAIYTGQDGKAGALAASMDARLKKEQEKLAALHIEKEYQSTLWVESKPSPRKTLLYLPAHQILTAQGWQVTIPTISLENTTHLGIQGQNGIGKTTLVKQIVSQITQEQDRTPLQLLYLPQELSKEKREQILTTIRSLSKQEKGKLLSIVAQLKSDPKRILDGNETSPGEARKLFLALGLLQAPELIIMDEPTNHLDIHSIEALEQALTNFPGALLLISHDETFMEATTNEIITLT